QDGAGGARAQRRRRRAVHQGGVLEGRRLSRDGHARRPLGGRAPDGTTPVRFANRAEGGRALASLLPAYANRDDVVVLGLPRGGVPTAAEIALALHAPLDAFVVRKLGVPGHSELAMGAIASGGVRVLSHDIIDSLRIPMEMVEVVSQRERRELERREGVYRGDRPLEPLKGRTVILVDDGLATGATMIAAVEAVRVSDPAKVVVAGPVGPRETCERLRDVADAIVCARMPEQFEAVGLWYEQFDQTTDDEVIATLARVRRAQGRG